MTAVLLGLVLLGSLRRQFVDDLGAGDGPIPFALAEGDDTWWSA